MTVMEHNYILGHSEAEIRRLQTQAAILRPITKRLLLESRLRKAILAGRSQVTGQPQVCAWAKTCFLND